jgi:phage tail protein X
MDIVRAKQGDTLDELLWRAARLRPNAIPDVLAVNPGLSDYVILPSGYAVTLPNISASPVTRPTVQLWS